MTGEIIAILSDICKKMQRFLMINIVVYAELATFRVNTNTSVSKFAYIVMGVVFYLLFIKTLNSVAYR